MKAKNSKTQAMRLKYVASRVLLILLIPLFGNFFIEGWNWGFFDFVFAFVALFVTGLLIDYVLRKYKNFNVRIAVISLILLAFVTLWVEVATDGVSRALSSMF